MRAAALGGRAIGSEWMKQVIVDFGVLKLFGAKLPLRIYGYGLMLILGFLLGMFLARWRARRAGEDPEHVTYCGVLALVGGIVGARIAFIIEKWGDHFARAPFAELFNVTSGGLIYYGGVALATAMVVVYLLAKRLPIRRYLDFLAASLMVGLAFGRAGCLLNGCCFGGPCRKDWRLAMRFPMYSKPLLKVPGGENPFSEATDDPSPAYAHQLAAKPRLVPDPRLVDEDGRLVPPRDFTPEQIAVAESQRSRPVKPAQALGLVNALLLAALLSAFHRLRTREGQSFALLMVLYPITRFVLESIRGDNPHDLLRGVLTLNQKVSLAVMAAGVIMLAALRRLQAPRGPTRAPKGAEGHVPRRRGSPQLAEGRRRPERAAPGGRRADGPDRM